MEQRTRTLDVPAGPNARRSFLFRFRRRISGQAPSSFRARQVTDFRHVADAEGLQSIDCRYMAGRRMVSFIQDVQSLQKSRRDGGIQKISLLLTPTYSTGFAQIWSMAAKACLLFSLRCPLGLLSETASRRGADSTQFADGSCAITGQCSSRVLPMRRHFDKRAQHLVRKP